MFDLPERNTYSLRNLVLSDVCQRKAEVAPSLRDRNVLPKFRGSV